MATSNRLARAYPCQPIKKRVQLTIPQSRTIQTQGRNNIRIRTKSEFYLQKHKYMAVFGNDALFPRGFMLHL